MTAFWIRFFVVPTFVLSLVNSVFAADSPLVATDVKQVDRDYWFQGEYLGSARTACGKCEACGLQVVALGKNEFQAVLYRGGLPGGGWWTGMTKHDFKGKRDGETLRLIGDDSAQRIEIQKSKAILQAVHQPPSPASEQVMALGELVRVERRSQTLGAAPPCGAIVLFDGSNTDHWNNGRKTDDGLLMEGTATKSSFQDFYMHIEFQLPYKPDARSQSRGNSGVYVQGRYEVQILDSFGLNGNFDEAGAIYRFKAPDTNLCFPSLVWQTFDIEFQSPKFDGEKKKTSSGTISVWHNGVLVQNQVKLANKTGAGAPEGPLPLPTKLQEHANPVRFRNIWLIDRSCPASGLAQSASLAQPAK